VIVNSITLLVQFLYLEILEFKKHLCTQLFIGNVRSQHRRAMNVPFDPFGSGDHIIECGNKRYVHKRLERWIHLAIPVNGGIDKRNLPIRRKRRRHFRFSRAGISPGGAKICAFVST
jgi:hypothetical protein